MQHEPLPLTDERLPLADRGRDGPARWRDRLVAGLVCLVVGLAGGVALGRATAPSRPRTLAEALQPAQQGKLPRGNLTAGGGQGLFRGRAGGGAGGTGNGAQGAGPGGPTIQGQITGRSGDVLTVSTRGGTLQVRLTAATAIRKAVAGKQSDLAVGDDVSVGLDLAAGGNGSVTARSVTAEPAS